MRIQGVKLRQGLLWAIALVGVLVTARLGWWQLDRAGQKLALQSQTALRGSLPALEMRDLPRTASELALVQHRRIQLRGRWLPGQTVYLDNRQMSGRPGFFVVTPFQLSDGTVLPVQRGWLPRDFIDRGRLASVATPVDEVQLRGRLAPPPSKLFQLGGADTGVIRQNLDLQAWALEIRHPLPALSVLQTEAEVPVGKGDGVGPADGLLRQWPAPAVDVGKHHGYAFQWFALSTLIAGLACWHLVIRATGKTSKPPV
jgi:surfeit locus 1 family protein